MTDNDLIKIGLMKSGLWPGVEGADRDDSNPLLVCADWFDENDAPRLAYALRWCAAHRCRPFFRPDVVRRRWVWINSFSDDFHRPLDPSLPAAFAALLLKFRREEYSGWLSYRKVQRMPQAVLPKILFWSFALDDGLQFVGFKTQFDAYDWLSESLNCIRRSVEKIAIVTPPVVGTVQT